MPSYFAYLTALQKATSGSCGLGGKQDINVTFRDGIICHGTLSDWEMITCSPNSELTLSVSDTCPKDQWTGKAVSCILKQGQ